MREAMQAALDAMAEAHDASLDDAHHTCRYALKAAAAKLEAALAAPESKSNTMAGFRGGFIGLHGRAPTEQEIWNAGVDSGRRRYAAPDPVAEFASQQRPLDADMAKVLHDNLWDLYEAAPVPAIAAPVEPVAWVADRDNCKVWWNDKFTHISQAPPRNTPLFLAPQSAPVAGRVISDAEIEALANEWSKYEGFFEFERNDFIRCVRAIIAKVEGK